MGQFLLGWQVLLRVWSDASFAGRIERLLEEPTSKAPPAEATTQLPAVPDPALTDAVPKAPSAAPEVSPRRSEALGLLSVLQREGRLLDFLQEPIESFSDAEIGAAVRPVHKDCAAVVERMFGVVPLSVQQEGTSIEVPAGHDPGQYRIVGSASGGSGGILRGTVMHAGWKATRSEVPTWTGRADSVLILAPVEVETA